MNKRQIPLIFGFLFICNFIHATDIKINSLNELAKYAAESGNTIIMAPGVYQMEDYLTADVVRNTKPDEIRRYAMIKFSGNNNIFDFTGVTIEVNTKLLSVFKSRVSEFYVSGNNVHIKGLTVTDIGNHPTFSGGHSFTVAGDDVRIEKVTLYVSGSSPYGYGDLLGKGDANLATLKKHSGMCIEGLNDTIIDCAIYSKAFGHLFFVQGGRNVLFENCYAEGVIRTTDKMLAETSGLAYDVNFAAVYKNYEGKKIITPGYTKSMNECGFRMYGKGGVKGITTGAVTAINCKAKNTRIGFAFGKVTDDILIKDSEAVGCEVGYYLTGVKVENSRGDMVNGPLLYVTKGEVSDVELALISNDSKTTVHLLAGIAGENHKVTIKKEGDLTKGKVLPIKIGTTSPTANNGFSPLGKAPTSGILLTNLTGMPVELNAVSSSCKIITNGEVTDKGINNEIVKN
ncbi:hypothetical protein EV196_104258 [Mariniflexile fucanivorans]|uniref:Parallel beta helix pectate lyase-like protein n=1 Tax=Mariniflexile fucanivorans TaxID=264023 RepID=A0A4V2QE01_9FLAO|nr:hypothetical protein [Mariniflexile fucanivorans]TCL66227.1 hypothetical protein EV196_104258 [Mariniflexile fucanivorans]